MMFKDERPPFWLCFIAPLAVIMVAIVAIQVKDKEQWETDAQARHCRVIATDNSGWFTKTKTWECPDGSVHTY